MGKDIWRILLSSERKKTRKADLRDKFVTHHVTNVFFGHIVVQSALLACWTAGTRYLTQLYDRPTTHAGKSPIRQ